MTAGFSYNLNTPGLRRLKEETNGRCPTREVARALAEEPLQFEPGERYMYSLGHDVLRRWWKCFPVNPLRSM